MTAPRGRDAEGAHRAWSGDRVPLRRAREAGGRVAGRWHLGAAHDVLVDESAVVPVRAALEGSRPGEGDHVAGTLVPGDPATLEHVVVLTPALAPAPPEILRAAAQRPILRSRAALLAGLRAWFDGAGFLEVETPTRVANPGMEPHLRPFPAPGRGAPLWLVTSPELHLKRLLAAGYERVFEMARCFRDEERGAEHLSEFLLLEWYRSHATIDDLVADACGLLVAAATAAGTGEVRRPGETWACDVSLPPEVLGYHEAFRAATGRHADDLPAAGRDELFATRVQPELGRTRPTFVRDWPSDAAALARITRGPDGRAVAARVELFVAGTELANGFDELTDPVEQRRRHESDAEARRRAGAAVPPLDEGFLEALACGMPPSAGMALGVDRLVMLLLGARSVDEVRAFAR